MKNLMTIMVAVIIIMVANQVTVAQVSYANGNKALTYSEYKTLKKDLVKDLKVAKQDLARARDDFKRNPDDSTFFEDIKMFQENVASLQKNINILDSRMTNGEEADVLNIKSVSAAKGAQAYLTVKQAQGNYEISQAIAKSVGSGQSNNQLVETGFAGIVVNDIYTNMNVDVYVAGTEKMIANFYLESHSSQTARLMPGTYYAVVTINGQKSPKSDNFIVDGTTPKYYKGLQVAWSLIKDTY